MFGSSRESLAGLRNAVQSHRGAADFRMSASELLAVAAVLAGEKSLRQTLADAGTPSQARIALVDSVFGGRTSETCIAMLRQCVSARWSTDADLVDAVQLLAIQMLCVCAQDSGALDTVEEELFLFGRAVASAPQLQMTLTDPSLPASAKADVVSSLLAGRGHDITVELLTHTVSHLGGQRLDAAIEDLVAVAADQRNRLVAHVTSAINLDDTQTSRLRTALSTLTGRDINVNITVDRGVIGGISVRLGDEIIDGTVASRLAAARTQLLND